jgi:transcriptional regulator with XRE-family HTH domain
MIRRSGLATIRKRAGFTQATLSQKIGISKHTISQWETGNETPSPRNRLKLATALSISMDELDQLIRGERLTRPHKRRVVTFIYRRS